MVHDRSCSNTLTEILRSAVRPSASKIKTCSAVSPQRTPPASSSIWASLMRRSALETAGPVGSTAAVRLLAISVPATRSTKTTTVPRIPAARRCVFITVSILRGSRCGMQFRYHERPGPREAKAETPRKLYDLRPEDGVHVDDTNGPASLVHDHQAGDLAGLHHFQRLRGQIVCAYHLLILTCYQAGLDGIYPPASQVDL